MLAFYYNNVLLGAPTNWRFIDLEASFENGAPSASLRAQKMEWHGVEKKAIQSWIDGPYGILQGMPFDIVDCSTSRKIKCLINLADRDTEISCDIISSTIREAGKIDFVNDVAAGFSFAYLYSLANNVPGKIYHADFRPIPYCISAIPNYTQAMLMALTTYTITKETIEIIEKIGELVADAVGVFTTIPGIIKIALYLIYLAALVVAIITLVQSIVDNIIQLAKYKYGMNIVTLAQRGAAFLGMTFSSDFLLNTAYKDACIIPRKVLIPNSRDKDDVGNSNSYGYPDGTFSDFLIWLEEVFCAEVKVKNNVLYLQRKKFWQLQSGFVIKRLAEDRWRSYKTNASDLASNYMIEWALDNQDLNTYDQYSGTSCQVIIECNAVNNVQYLLLRGLVQKSLPFALCKRKETLTSIENLLNNIINLFFGIANVITSSINAILNFVNSSFQIPQLPTNILNNRIGWLLLSSDYIGVQKFGIFGSNNKLDPNNKELTAAKTLMIGSSLLPAPYSGGFHSVELATRGAQMKLYDNKTEKFCCDDFYTVLGNNNIKDEDGTPGLAYNVKWRDSDDFAVINYGLQKDWYPRNKLKETVIIDGNN